MKKRIAMALCILMVMLMFGACGTDPEAVDYNGYSYDDLKAQTESGYGIAMSIADFFGQYGIAADEITEADREALIAYNGLTGEQFDAGVRWMEVVSEVGSFQEVYQDSFSVEKAGDTLTTNIRMRFEKRDVDFQVVYTYYNMKISGFTMEPVYSMSEKLSKAGINTLISILVVFCVLVLISLLIACFRIFPYLEKQKKERLAARTPVREQPEPAGSQPEIQETAAQQPDDGELIAVIAAAIAAGTGTSASDFVVRSINRR
ncbi:MAG: OadG family protein [Muribaculaceae bacterium]|nr:OadG family protein [Roseburia sp.]MCM1430441.1 OadG family protein [Muribaculaceae bacterium]MCM1492363.1 OadG family protein [Muribaculaceae bacterium]